MSDRDESIRQIGRRLVPDMTRARAAVLGGDRGPFRGRRRVRFAGEAAIAAGAAALVIGVSVGLANHLHPGNQGARVASATSPSASPTLPQSSTPLPTPTAAATPTHTIAPTATSRPTPTPRPTVTLTNGNFNQTIRVVRGTVIVVKLSPEPPDYDHYYEPESTDAQIVARQSGSEQADGSAQATFVAMADGTAAIQSGVKQPPCSPSASGGPCPMTGTSALWGVHIAVVG